MMFLLPGCELKSTVKNLNRTAGNTCYLFGHKSLCLPEATKSQIRQNVRQISKLSFLLENSANIVDLSYVIREVSGEVY
jgi:hypothetical protein